MEPCEACQEKAKRRITVIDPPHPPVECARGCGQASHRGRCKGQTEPASELKLPLGIFSESRVAGLQIRFPTSEELAGRFKRGPKTEMMDAILDALQTSPTGALEVKLPLGLKLHSFHSRIGLYLRKNKLGGRYTLHSVEKTSTVVVVKK